MPPPQMAMVKGLEGVGWRLVGLGGLVGFVVMVGGGIECGWLVLLVELCWLVLLVELDWLVLLVELDWLVLLIETCGSGAMMSDENRERVPSFTEQMSTLSRTGMRRPSR